MTLLMEVWTAISVHPMYLLNQYDAVGMMAEGEDLGFDDPFFKMGEEGMNGLTGDDVADVWLRFYCGSLLTT